MATQRGPITDPHSVTREADYVIECIVSVNKSQGKDGRKARMLAQASLVLLSKISQTNPSVLLLLKTAAQGKGL